MGYQIVMTPEVGRWLSDIRERDPATAAVIDAALDKLRTDGAGLAPPLVVPVNMPLGQSGGVPGRRARRWESSSGTWRGRRAARAALWLPERAISRIALAALDGTYRRQLAEQARMRRAAADAAISRKRSELEVGQVEAEIGPAASQSRLDALRSEHAALQDQEKRVFLANQRLQTAVATFRSASDAVKSALAVEENTARAARAQLRGNADTQGAPSELRGVGITDLGPAPMSSWLSELRPGAPESTAVRILFTTESQNIVVLLAGATESDWLTCWYTEILPLCRSRYRQEQRRRARSENAVSER